MYICASMLWLLYYFILFFVLMFSLLHSAQELATFGSEELSEEDMSINASCFVSSSTKKGEHFIITGGENGHAHVWKIRGGGGGSGSGGRWEVTKVREFEHHKGPIKAIRPHPTRSWVSDLPFWSEMT